MQSDRDLLKQALKTLEIAKRVANCAYNTGQSSIQWDSNIRPTIDEFDALSPKAITALRERLAQPKQEQGPPQFPTMLRKMWSCGEVQKWINENWNKHGNR